MMARYRPSQASATQATGSGNIWEMPFHKSMDAAAPAIGCPSGPVRYVIRFEPNPTVASRSQKSFAVHRAQAWREML